MQGRLRTACTFICAFQSMGNVTLVVCRGSSAGTPSYFGIIMFFITQFQICYRITKIVFNVFQRKLWIMYTINMKRTKSTLLMFSVPGGTRQCFAGGSGCEEEPAEQHWPLSHMLATITVLTTSQLAFMNFITILLAARQKSTLNVVDQMYGQWRQTTSVRV